MIAAQAPSTDCRIQPASADDIPAMCALLALLFTQEADFTADTAKQARGLQLILDEPARGCLLVARAGEEHLGMVNLLFTVSTACGAPVALLEDLIVRPEARGCGIGDALLRAAIDSARNAGCARITLLTDDDNLTAQRFYTRHGFVHSAMRPLRLDLLNGR